jgi:DNA-binding GntR family transcriptional regulator
MLVEPYAAGEAACHGSSEQFECVRKNLNDMYRICETEAATKVKHDEEETRSILWCFAQADMKFHQTVLAAANNTVLSRFAKHLMDSFYLVPFTEMDLNVALANLQESIDSHQVILEALQKRNPMAASQAMYDSIKAGERNVDKWAGIPPNLFMSTDAAI